VWSGERSRQETEWSGERSRQETVWSGERSRQETVWSGERSRQETVWSGERSRQEIEWSVNAAAWGQGWSGWHIVSVLVHVTLGALDDPRRCDRPRRWRGDQNALR
jgi:hypothetical protein